MSIKLKHSGGNSVSLNPPTSAPTSTEVAFKLPNADGSAKPINRQNPRWKDKFSTEIQGSQLVVKRLDQNAGWGQQLMLRARAPKAHPKTGYWRPQGPRNGTVVTKAITLEQ